MKRQSNEITLLVKSPFLSDGCWAGLEGTDRRVPVMGARGCDGGVLRAVASHANLVAPDARGGVPQEKRTSHSIPI